MLWPILIAGSVLLLVLLGSSLMRGSHSESPPPPSKLQAAITSALQEQLSENKQQLYEKIHLAGSFGTAKNDVIQSVSMQWKGGRATDVAADLAGFAVDHTLYWSTPLTSDGHTKFHDTYNCANGTPQLLESKVVESNGYTVEGVTNSFIEYATKEATKAFHDALNPTPTPNP